jgi:hypothetical protein
VRELVGADHRADRLDLAAEHVERHRGDHLAVPVAEDRARLPVHLTRLYSRADPGQYREDRREHAGHVAGAGHAPGERRRLASPVPDHLNVGGQQFPQPVDVAVTDRGEEAGRQLVAFPAVHLEPGAPVAHMAPAADRELAAGRLGPADGRGDLGKAEPEYIPEHEYRPLEGAEPLQQQQRRHGQRVSQFRRPRRIFIRVGQERLREPRPGIGLPPDAGRSQHVDGDPGDHGREEGPGRRGLGRRRLVAQPGLLDRVLRLAHAAEDAVGDREQQRPQLLELLAPGHVSSSLKPGRHDG